MLSISYTKENNFSLLLRASLEGVFLPNGVYSLRKVFAPRGVNPFLSDLTERRKTKMLPLKVYSSPVRIFGLYILATAKVVVVDFIFPSDPR